MFFRKTEIERADLLGERLVGGATETASIILEEMGKRYNVRLRDADAAPQFIIEVIVFFMHLVDRMAFGILGWEKREIFGDRLQVAVTKEILAELSKDISADDFGEALRETYNRRQMQYSRYKLLVPNEKDDPLKDTLYWEVSKILFEYINNYNPVTLVFMNMLVIDVSDVFLTKAANVEEVLRS
jgi:hypothetical protein